MTTEFLKKQLQQRWETIICPEGESCWCRGIIIEGTYDRRAEVDENGNEINIVVGWGELSKTLVEHIVNIHNDSINSNNIPTPQPKGTYDNIEYGASVTYKLTKDEDGNKGLVEVNDFKLEDFTFHESEVDNSYAYILTRDGWEYEINSEDDINFYVIISRVWEDGFLHKQVQYELKNVSIYDCVKYINDYKNNKIYIK